MAAEKTSQHWRYIQGRSSARGGDADEREQREWEWASRDHQAELKRRIEAQDLPVRERIGELEDSLESAIDGKGVVLFQGETGSGKSVYSPIAVRRVLTKRGLPDRTVMMQPRRDAASGIARAVSAVSNTPLGRDVGFSTSEAKALRGDTAVNIVTSGIFLRYLTNGDLTREHVGALIVDELHEGSIDYHLALGLMKMMKDKGDLPLTLLTSATLNKKRIQDFFGLEEEDYLKIEGRTHPVDIRHRKTETQEGERRGVKTKESYIAHAAEEVHTMCASSTRGDILVFMPGAREIQECIKLIGDIPNVEVLPLHGMLGPDDRDNALRGKGRNGGRRVIVSTNIAETSVTIPGITMVVDSCRQRSVRYNPQTGIIEMGTELISKDQAEQRAGRAGRVQPGEAVRILSEKEFQTLPDHPESEIRRTNLSHLILRLKRLGIDPEHFPFIEPPNPEAIHHGIEELKHLGALDETSALTDLGQEMGDLPFEPRIARMIVEAKKHNCLEPSLVLAAFAREQNVLLGPKRKDEEEAEGYGVDEKRLNARKKVQAIQDRFDRGGSDWLKALSIFAEAIDYGVFEATRKARNPDERRKQHAFDAWCKEYYLKPEALRHIAYRLQDYARYAGVRLDQSRLKDQLLSASDEDLGSVILSGHPDLLMYQVGRYHIPTYRRLSDRYSDEINMSPGSEGWNSKPALCIASDVSQGKGRGRRGAEIVRNYANGVHPITLHQLREVMPHMVDSIPRSSGYNPETDRVERTLELRPKGISLVLGEEKEEVTGDKAVQLFAQYLARASEPSFTSENRQVKDTVDKLRIRSGGQVQPPDLEKWYRERLGNVHTMAEAKMIEEHLQMHLDDQCPPEFRQKIEQSYPEEIMVRGVQIRIAYEYSTWNSDVSFVARMNIPDELLWVITDADIPSIGIEGHAPTLRFYATVDYNSFEEKSIEALQRSVDNKRQTSAWWRWEEKPKPFPIEVQDDRPLPTPESLGYSPIAYTTNFRGEQVYAYPAVAFDTPSFAIRYFSNLAEAQNATEAAERERVRRETERLAKLEAEKRKAEIAERLVELDAPLQMLQVPGRYGFSQYDVSSFEYNLRRTRSEIDNNDVKAAERRLEEASRSLERLQKEFAERVERARAQCDHLVELGVGVWNGGVSNLGLSESERDDFRKQWQEANELLVGSATIEPDAADPVKAESILKKIEENLRYFQRRHENLAQPPREERWKAPTYQETYTVHAERPEESELARKLRLAMEAKSGQGEGLKEGVQMPAETLAPEKAAAPERPREEEVMTDERRRDLAAYAEFLRAVGRSVPRGASKGQTKRDQALAQFSGRTKECMGQLTSAAQEAERDGTRPASVAGKLTNIQGSFESLFDRNAPFVIDGYVRGWVKPARELWQAVPDLVRTSPDAREFIESGLTTEEDVTRRLYDAITESIPAMQIGERPALAVLLERVLSSI